MFKVLLCVPPDYDHHFPPLGTPALCAFLKKNGIAASQVDLNILYREFLVARIEGAGVTVSQKRTLLKPLLKKFFSENLKSRYYSPYFLREGRGVFSDLPYDNNTNTSFHFTEELLSSPHLFRYLKDENENTFYQFFQNSDFIEDLGKENIDLLGISITSPSQVIPSLTLGQLVKTCLPQVHVNIGGQWVTLFRQALQSHKEFYRYFDSMAVFEGETPLFHLAQALDGGRDLSKIPNVLTQETGTSAVLDPKGENMDLLPCPDFDGLPLALYDESHHGQMSLTFETSRGCYWSKCAYCVDLPLPKPSYRAKDAALVVRDIAELQKKHGVRMLLLGDPGMSPRQMSEVSRSILNEKIDVAWWCMARLDPGFTPEIFKMAKAAGLVKVNFGFESASDRVCDLLDKGNSRARSERIIRDCSASGIEVDLQTIVGLPTETLDDALDTVDFLIKNRDHISAVTFNNYYVTPANHVYNQPQKYGLILKNDESRPFRFFVPFDNPKGLGRDEAYFVQQVYYSLLRKREKPEVTVPLKMGAQQRPQKSNEWRVRLNLCGESAMLADSSGVDLAAC
ncbi:MAG: radical SAM protein [Candidatus Omnitrophica bacterium]|nr:radical SAM protein [Candidatus Omnitrophota bacterium]